MEYPKIGTHGRYLYFDPNICAYSMELELIGNPSSGKPLTGIVKYKNKYYFYSTGDVYNQGNIGIYCALMVLRVTVNITK